MRDRKDWLRGDCTNRVRMRISPNGYARVDASVDVEIEGAACGAIDSRSLHVLEVDGGGRIVDPNVPHQWTACVDGGTLTLLLQGKTSTNRCFEAYWGGAGTAETHATPTQVRVDDVPDYNGQPSFRIQTPTATYVYHKVGAGFAAIFDREGNDWIGHRPGGGSDGIYRGVPNLVHPESYFHPGYPGCRSRLTAAGPLKATVESSSEDGAWSCRWDIYAAYARMTVLAAARPYWFLYEGTPGGVLDEAGDAVVRSTGERTTARERWTEQLADPRWLYFVDGRSGRSLYVVHHERDGTVDSYWPMNGEMTVFGFGRNHLEKSLEAVPAHFTLGLAEDSEFEAMRRTIDAAFRPWEIVVDAQ